MKFVKLTNIKQTKGMGIYRGLDIMQFVPESIFYPMSYDFCILKTNEVEVPKHKHLHEISEYEYNEILRNLTSK